MRVRQWLVTSFFLLLLILIFTIDQTVEFLHLAEYAVIVPVLAVPFVAELSVIVVSMFSVLVALAHAFQTMEPNQGMIHAGIATIMAAIAVFFKRIQGQARTFDMKLESTSLELIQAERQSNLDPLTEQLNRRGVERSVSRLSVESWPRAVMIFDIDRLKYVNDTFGHEAGDDLIRIVAFRISRAIQQVDIFGRWGGDEFIGVFCVDLDTANQIANRLLERVTGQPIRFADTDVTVGISIGVAAWEPTRKFEAAISEADYAMYNSKKFGGSKVSVGDSL